MTIPHQEQGIRHRLPDRLFHWVMAVSVIVAGGTAFLPILGLRFEWLPLHWISGVVLTLGVLFHLYRVFAVHGIWEMVPVADDWREVMRDIRGTGGAGLAEAKYDSLQKGYHFATALTVLALVLTGLVMLAKIDTTFWRRDPSILTDQTWGIIYVLHGATAMALLFLFILHLYFSLLPEHRALLVSMLRGRGPECVRGGQG